MSTAEIAEWLAYDPATGVLTWKKRPPSCRVRAGDVAGSAKGHGGYVRVKVKGKLYRASRVAWAIMTGAWPKDDIDHEDLDKGNNRWLNLRPATKSQNYANRPAQHNNKTGLKGASWHKKSNRFRASIKVNGKVMPLGLFSTAIEAHQAYVAAAQKHFGSYSRAR